jgi:hypothetical protein
MPAMSDQIKNTTEPIVEVEQQRAVVNFMIAPKPDLQVNPPRATAISKVVLEYVKVLIWPIVIAAILWYTNRL